MLYIRKCSIDINELININQLIIIMINYNNNINNSIQIFSAESQITAIYVYIS